MKKLLIACSALALLGVSDMADAKGWRTSAAYRAKREAEARARQEAYERWYNSLSPLEKATENGRAEMRIEADKQIRELNMQWGHDATELHAKVEKAEASADFWFMTAISLMIVGFAAFIFAAIFWPYNRPNK